MSPGESLVLFVSNVPDRPVSTTGKTGGPFTIEKRGLNRTTGGEGIPGTSPFTKEKGEGADTSFGDCFVKVKVYHR